MASQPPPRNLYASMAVSFSELGRFPVLDLNRRRQERLHEPFARVLDQFFEPA